METRLSESEAKAEEPNKSQSVRTCIGIGLSIGVRAGGARGAAAPPKFGQLRFFGQQEKIWAKPVFTDVSMFYYYYYFEEINIFYFNQRSA